MIGPTTGEPSDERAIALAEILRTMPGNDSEVQRNRMLTAMQRLGRVTSYEGARFLDCYDPRARIYELRLAGYHVTTVMRATPTESGVLHYVGVYVLEGPATYPLFCRRYTITAYASKGWRQPKSECAHEHRCRQAVNATTNSMQGDFYLFDSARSR